jgi:DNA ligase-1
MSYHKTDDFSFYAFDKWDEPSIFSERFWQVKHAEENLSLKEITGYDAHRYKIADTRLLESMDMIRDFHDEMIAQGHEGIILRDPNAYYKYGRGSPVKCECIKMKEGGWVDTECKILGFHEQLHNANEVIIDRLGHTERSGHKENLIGKDTLGSIEVSGNFEDGSPFTCRVGTGLNDEIRQKVWDRRHEYWDRVVKIKYFKVGIKDKPRFPTFIGFRDRDDMDAEQLGLF